MTRDSAQDGKEHHAERRNEGKHPRENDRERMERTGDLVRE